MDDLKACTVHLLRKLQDNLELAEDQTAQVQKYLHCQGEAVRPTLSHW